LAAVSAPRSRPAVLLALYAGALAISAFTIRRGGAEFDEGIVLQAAARIAAGQMPYADFAWAYGPAHAYLLGWSFDLLDPSLIGWRVLRSLVDAGVAVTVYALVRRAGGPAWPALAGWLIAACAMAQPTSASPFAPALLLGLLAVATATADRPLPGGLLIPAALTALSAAWRLDFGLYAAGAVAVALLLSRPTGVRGRGFAVATYAAVTAALGLLIYLPFLIAVGPADLYDALVGASVRDRDYWTLPFPLSYDGPLRLWPPADLAEDGKDALGFYAPLLAVVGLGVVVVWSGLRLRVGRAIPVQLAALTTLGGGCLLYLLSRTDEFHATPMIVVLAAALPAAIATRSSRAVPLTALTVALTALLLAYGVANRVSALVRPPDLTAIDLPVADGALAPPGEARALERMAAIVARAVPPGEPIYTITRRSDLVRFNQPLVYVLADRPNPTRHEFAIATSASDQRALTEELGSDPPRAIVRWTDPISVQREPNLRGKPTGAHVLDRWVAHRYRLLERTGDYEILVPRTPG
jgi:hypothetical protein